jgi:hypothetical protein
MALEPTKHVNGRMWPPGVEGRVGLAGGVGFFVGLSHPHPLKTQPLRTTCELDEPSSAQPS